MRKYFYYLFLLVFISCKKHNTELPDRDYSNDPEFVIPIFPDTQEAVSRREKMFKSQVNWIVKHKAELHIPIALHVGDMVNYDTTAHWETASEIMQILDKGKVPYAIAVGNHDTEVMMPNSFNLAPGDPNTNLRKTYKFNNYFPISRFTTQVARYELNKSDNALYTFKAGGKKWIVVTLEYCARQGAARWADSILDVYADYNAIVLTHYHLTPEGNISTANGRYGDMKVINIFNDYLKKHSNLLLILSGHVCYSATRTDTGTNGNIIYSVLQDYQKTDCGGGYLRLLRINTLTGTISGEIYSPYYNNTLVGDGFSYTGVKFIE